MAARNPHDQAGLPSWVADAFAQHEASGQSVNVHPAAGNAGQAKARREARQRQEAANDVRYGSAPQAAPRAQPPQHPPIAVGAMVADVWSVSPGAPAPAQAQQRQAPARGARSWEELAGMQPAAFGNRGRGW